MPRPLAANDDVLAPQRAKLLALDEDGLHKNLPVAGWWGVIGDMAAEGLPWSQWPETHQDMVRMTLRFTRPDGSASFEPPGPRPERLALLRSFSDPGLATISQWWSPAKSKTIDTGPPPLPAFGTISRPIAMLRADWAKDGDFLAVDARSPANQKIELTVGGRPMLGPEWPGAMGRARMKFWKSSHLADCAEWSSGAGALRRTRIAVFLRGKKLVLIAEERADGSAKMPLLLADRVDAKIIAETRTIALKTVGGATARVIPFGLGEAMGSLVAEGGTLTLHSPPTTNRTWLPLLISWDSDRNRQSLKWRLLTVSEDTKACKPGVAFAARVSWGFGEQYVIYRSLGRPALRSFLGHQTSARFLIGSFNEKGDVTPLLRID